MKPCLVIAEAGVNHNGSEELAFDLVNAAVAAGADAVKFQTFKAEKLVTRAAKKAAYQVTQTGVGDQFAMLKALELSDAAHERLAAYCDQSGIEFLSTAFDEESADFLVALGCRRLKIPSGELTNAPFVRYLASKGLPLILSTGMADLHEVAQTVIWIAEARERAGHGEPLREVLTLLHCTSNYPAPLSDVNLLAMQTLAEQFGLPVGYSDHTQGISVAPIARALGAVLYEKHFTLDRSLPGPDHAASLEPVELKQMVDSLRRTDVILGNGIKAPTTPELEVRIAARRSVTLARDVAEGVPLTAEDLCLMRPGDGIPPAALEQVLGRHLQLAMAAGQTLHWEALS
ncbi:MAG: N-acetylneuraminate synthase [Gammaproteobacteria bacterium]|nr:N-acetylneuraminate synthase [Gammaproteobacteria bacterium]MBU0801612.1 N-acetylneuraminate synthase [Alphaproteobacteria bacterium]MBU1804118.1 N-acetylneuraminate synthase [Gammaproteobacteria bacterium]